MPPNKGGRGKCSACSHPRRDTINRELLSGLSYALLSKRYGISRVSLSNHKANHLSPGDTALHKARPSTGIPSGPMDGPPESVLGELRQALESLRPLLDEGSDNLKVTAMRELRQTLELIAKITGELDERPTTVINLVATSEWLEVRKKIFDTLKRPEFLAARIAVANALLGLGHGQVVEQLPALPPRTDFIDVDPIEETDAAIEAGVLDVDSLFDKDSTTGDDL